MSNRLNNLRLEEFKALFKCQVCSNLLVKPVNLPCGESICESHKEQFLKNKCQFGDHIHSNENEYQVNEKLKKMVELQANEIKLSPKFDDCKKNIDKAEESMKKIDLVINDPDNFINKYFENIKGKVETQRVEMKKKIDEHADSILDKVNQTQNDCYKLSKEIQKFSIDIAQYKKELNTLIQRFDSFVFIDKNYDNIFLKLNKLKPKLENILEDCKYSLIGGRDYEFKVHTINIEKVLGKFVSHQRKKFGLESSKIIQPKQVVSLMKLCEFSEDERFKPIYTASIDGFTSKDIHKKCNGINNTLTIIKTTSNNIFGDYTATVWNSKGLGDDFIEHHPGSFIFSLTNKFNDPFKANRVSNQDRFDFRISSDSNVNQRSYSDFGKSFRYKTKEYEGTILAGCENFQTIEIEVFQMKYDTETFRVEYDRDDEEADNDEEAEDDEEANDDNDNDDNEDDEDDDDDDDDDEDEDDDEDDEEDDEEKEKQPSRYSGHSGFQGFSLVSQAEKKDEEPSRQSMCQFQFKPFQPHGEPKVAAPIKAPIKPQPKTKLFD